MRTNQQRLRWWSIGVGGIAVFLGAALVASAQQKAAGGYQSPFGKQTRMLIDALSINTLMTTGPAQDWKAAANPERTRGFEKLYSSVAPCVVAVRTRVGHGTGFFVSADGYIITNNHVIDDGAGLDAAAQGSIVEIYTGALASGTMELKADPLIAFICAADPVRDLALLKLRELPPGVAQMPFLKLSETEPTPGQTCAIIGNPSSGMLWTFRSGEVAASGRSPNDMLNVVMQKLFAPGDERAAIERALADAESCRIILSSCQATHGDSGGPVVNEQGEVIAVTFAGPSDATDDKFTYHVHLAELKAFLSGASRTPIVLLPDPYRVAPRIELRDPLGDGRATVLVAGTTEPAQWLLDLDADTPEAALTGDDLRPLVRQRRFEFEFAFHAGPAARYGFYDSDNDGALDIVLIAYAKEPGANIAYRRDAEGRWSVEYNTGEPLINPDLMKDKMLAKRMALLGEKL